MAETPRPQQQDRVTRMATPVLVAMIAAFSSLASMFFSVFVAAWAKRRAERIDARHAEDVAARIREAEQLRLDRAEQWVRTREEIAELRDEVSAERAMRVALSLQLENEQKLRRECQAKMEQQEQRIRELERRH